MSEGVFIEGLDLMIDGEVPLLARGGVDLPGTAILIRGGPGTGKTILATHLASAFATTLRSDVAYACVEVLPSELQAQHARLYGGKPPTTVELPGTTRPKRTGAVITATAIPMGGRSDHEETRSAFERAIVTLVEGSHTPGSKPLRVLVIDSVSDGYGLGRSAPRLLCDNVCKYAAAAGLVVVIVEEVVDVGPSNWSFAVDLVLEVDNAPTPTGERHLRVSKNRLGPTLTAPAEYAIVAGKGPQIRPPLAAYFTSDLRRFAPRLGVADVSWGYPEMRAVSWLPPPTDATLAVIDAGDLRLFDGIFGVIPPSPDLAQASRAELTSTRLSSADRAARSRQLWIQFGGSERTQIFDSASGDLVQQHSAAFVSPEYVLSETRRTLEKHFSSPGALRGIAILYHMPRMPVSFERDGIVELLLAFMRIAEVKAIPLVVDLSSVSKNARLTTASSLLMTRRSKGRFKIDSGGREETAIVDLSSVFARISSSPGAETTPSAAEDAQASSTRHNRFDEDKEQAE